MLEFGDVIYVGLCALKRLRWRKLASKVVEIETQWIEKCLKSMLSMGTVSENDGPKECWPQRTRALALTN